MPHHAKKNKPTTAVSSRAKGLVVPGMVHGPPNRVTLHIQDATPGNEIPGKQAHRANAGDVRCTQIGRGMVSR